MEMTDFRTRESVLEKSAVKLNMATSEQKMATKWRHSRILIHLNIKIHGGNTNGKLHLQRE